jgi:signal peptidase
MRARGALALVAWVVAGYAVGLALATGGPVPFGMQSLTVLSGSMEPVLSTGDVVVERKVRATDVRVGDIVTYNDPDRRGRRITHRVRSIRIDGARARFVTKGDANDSVERWEIDAHGHLGRVAYRVPLVGYGLARLNGPRAKLLLVVVPALLLAMLELVRIWRPRAREPEVADAAG